MMGPPTIKSALILVYALLSSACFSVTHAVVPSAKIVVLPRGASDNNNNNGNERAGYSMLASQASFGPLPPMLASDNPVRTFTLPPDDNPLMCNNVTNDEINYYNDGKYILLVPRGVCTFEIKALNAQLMGADAVVIYGTLASRYSLNTTGHDENDNGDDNDNDNGNDDYTSKDIIYPQEFYDYDCSKLRAEIPSVDLKFDQLPYNSQHNDPLLTGDTKDNLCIFYSDSTTSPSKAKNTCPSHACLLTGRPVKDSQNDVVEACCAWDTYIWLYSDITLKNPPKVTIPTSYITINQGISLLQDMAGGDVQATIHSRHRTGFNISSILVWILGVSVAALAAYMSAGDYHHAIQKVSKRLQAQFITNSNTASTTTNTTNNADIAENQNSNNEDDALATRPIQQQRQQDAPILPMHAVQDEILELTPLHALGFVVMASSGLLILFFFKIYSFVKVLYALGCSGAIVQVIFHPLCRFIARYCKFRDFIVWRTGTVDFGDITYLDIVSTILGYAVGLSWLYVAFAFVHPENNTFFWVAQDIFGACMCIVFLSVIRLNSIRVASILLIVAFLYDIFFVFVTPLIFKGESVMITVATSGGPPKADPGWCEKYPTDADCRGGDPLPMLFTMPRIGDYEGGASMLGLGDIVLPGLLISFAARMDAAKSLVGLVGGGSGAINNHHACPERRFCWSCRLCSGGYFWPIVVAYGIGLSLANVAVIVMEMGQPALLYLVPCTLGCISFMGWRRGELNDLWKGPRILATADEIVYGRSAPTTTVPSSDPGETNNDNNSGQQQQQQQQHGDQDQQESGTILTDDAAAEAPLLSGTGA